MLLRTFSFPTKTRFGAGTLAELPDSLATLGIRRPLVVTDSGLAKTDAFLRLTTTLCDSGRGREWFVFDGVHPNPIEDDVRI
ncbi:MAG: iron-containing alcohol dehydrogenase, partial [Verrucomicrobiota bacterium]